MLPTHECTAAKNPVPRRGPPGPARALRALVLAAGLAAAAPGHGITFFEDRTDWLAALSEPLGFEEDFSSFAVDTRFGDGGAHDVGPFILRAESDIGDQGNFIDVSPFATIASVEFTTTYLVGFVDGDGVFFDMLFEPGISAWGTDYSGAATGEGLTVEIATTIGLETFDVTDDDGFLGFILDPAERWTQRIRFAATTADGTLASGEAFALDDVAGIYLPAPEPPAAVLALTGLAVLALGSRRRPRRRSPGNAR